MTLAEFFAIVESDPHAAAKWLADAPWLANAVDSAGSYQRGGPAPALVHAAHRGLTQTVEALLDAGARIDSRGMGGGTALHVAGWAGHSATVLLLLDRGAPIEDCCTEYRATPLLWAAQGYSADGCRPLRDQVGAARLLLRAGADPTAVNRWGRQPRDLVLEPAGNPMLELLDAHSEASRIE